MICPSDLSPWVRKVQLVELKCARENNKYSRSINKETALWEKFCATKCKFQLVYKTVSCANYKLQREKSRNFSRLTFRVDRGCERIFRANLVDFETKIFTKKNLKSLSNFWIKVSEKLKRNIAKLFISLKLETKGARENSNAEKCSPHHFFVK